VNAMPTARLKSGAKSRFGVAKRWARRDFRPTGFFPTGFSPTGVLSRPGPGPLQFRGDDLLELHNVSREFADTFRQFLGSHRVLVQRETECFLVE
jgi:hypothetical protein